MIDPGAILALLADLQVRVSELQAENATLREQLRAALERAAGEPQDSAFEQAPADQRAGSEG